MVFTVKQQRLLGTQIKREGQPPRYHKRTSGPKPECPTSPTPPLISKALSLNMFTLDRSTFKTKTFAEADSNAVYWRTQTPADRLRALEFLNRQAWNIAPEAELRLDRTAFAIRSRKNETVLSN